MAEKKATLVQFRPSGLEAQLEARGDTPGGVAKRDLMRYYRHLMRSLDEVHLDFEEAVYLTRALSATPLDARVVHLLWAIVDEELKYPHSEDQFGLTLALKGEWELDSDRMMKKLHAFTYCQALAVYDAVERFMRLDTIIAASTRLVMAGLWRGPEERMEEAMALWASQPWRQLP